MPLKLLIKKLKMPILFTIDVELTTILDRFSMFDMFVDFCIG